MSLSGAVPPNDRLRALVEVIGAEDARDLVRLFLETTPKLLADIGGDDLERARRAAHTLKSSAQQMGAADLSQAAAAAESRLSDAPAPLSKTEHAALVASYETISASLSAFAGP